MKRSIQLALSAFLLTTSSAQAGLISDYSLNEATNIVTDSTTGLEWLRWTETHSMSIDDALDIYGAQGWEVATNEQAANLFNDFDLAYGEFLWDAHEETAQVADVYSGVAVELPVDRELRFIELFGHYEHSDGTWASALFGTDKNNNGLVNLMSVNSGYAISDTEFFGFNFMDPDLFSGSEPMGGAGVALVRSLEADGDNNNNDGDFISVSEPVTGALLGLALAGMGVRRLRRK